VLLHVTVEGVPVAKDLAAVGTIVGGGRQVDGLNVTLHVAALPGAVAAGQTLPHPEGVLPHLAFKICNMFYPAYLLPSHKYVSFL
jgi:hypothetical protein